MTDPEKIVRRKKDPTATTAKKPRAPKAPKPTQAPPPVVEVPVVVETPPESSCECPVGKCGANALCKSATQFGVNASALKDADLEVAVQALAEVRATEVPLSFEAPEAPKPKKWWQIWR